MRKLRPSLMRKLRPSNVPKVPELWEVGRTVLRALHTSKVYITAVF